MFSHQYCSNGTLVGEAAGSDEASGARAFVPFVPVVMIEATSREESTKF